MWRALGARVVAVVGKGLVLVALASAAAVAADLVATTYLRDVVGRRLLDAHRSGFAVPMRSVARDASGNRLGSYAAPEAVREPIDRVPALFRLALVRWEDARFFAHDGVDRYRLVGALAAIVGGDPQGGSTLTMQLAKLVKRDGARTVRRKLEDIALALAMDARLGKEAVLRLYAEHAYFGGGVHGLGAACGYHFARVGCEGLTLSEAAYLVALLRAPSELAADDERALARRNAVLDALREPATRTWWDRWHRAWAHRIAGRIELTGLIDEPAIEAARGAPLGLVRKRETVAHPFVVESARLELQRTFGESLYRGGYDVRLSVVPEVQRAAEAALATGLEKLRRLQASSARAGDDLDGGLVVLDPRDGRMLAYVPGADFSASQVAFAARPIQVGSSLKPFVYAELLESGRGDLDTIFPDRPLRIGRWRPGNYDGRYHGKVPVRFALAHSLNTVAVRVAQLVGVDALVSRLRLLGVSGPLTANLPMALGASELTLLELAGMYAALFDGHVVRPWLVASVSAEGREVWRERPESPGPVAYRPETVRAIRAAMQDVLRSGGTASVLGRALEAAFDLKPPQRLGDDERSPQIACKTGTHDGFTRVGLGCLISDSDHGPLVAIAYIGHRTPRSLGEGLTGGRVVGPVMESLVMALTQARRGSATFARFPGAVVAESSVPIETATSVEDEDACSDASALAPEAPDAVTIGAPEGWPGLEGLEAESIDAHGPALVADYLVHGGRESELVELASLVGLDISERVIHAQRLLGPGFSSRPVHERIGLVVTRIARSLGRMATAQEAPVEWNSPEPRVERLSRTDGDRRLERTYRFLSELDSLSVTRHGPSGRLLEVRWTLMDGTRFVSERQGRRWASLSTRQVKVQRGSLEQAWLGAGLSSSALDGLRAMFGERIDLDRIQRGFALEVLLSEGRVAGVEARVPPRGGGAPRTVGAWLIDGACLSEAGVPCSGRMAPLPMAETRTYGPVGASTSGGVMVQRERAGAVPLSPVSGTVVAADRERRLLSIVTDDGSVLEMAGVRSGLRLQSRVDAGAALGELDLRGVLVTRTLRAEEKGQLVPMPAWGALAPVSAAEGRLVQVVERRRALHRWLRGRDEERPRRTVSGRGPT